MGLYIKGVLASFSPLIYKLNMAFRKKITEDQYYDIAKMLLSGKYLKREIADKFNITVNGLAKITKTEAFKRVYRAVKLSEYDYGLEIKYSINEMLEKIFRELRKRFKSAKLLSRMDTKELLSAIKIIKELVNVNPTKLSENSSGVSIPIKLDNLFKGSGSPNSKAEKLEILSKLKNESDKVVDE